MAASATKQIRDKLRKIVNAVDSVVVGDDNPHGSQPFQEDKGLREVRSQADELEQVLDELDALGVDEMPESIRADSLDISEDELIRLALEGKARDLMAHADLVFQRLEDALALVEAGSIAGEPPKEAAQSMVFSHGSGQARPQSTEERIAAFFEMVPGGGR